MIEGGLGRDLMRGNGGSDTFVYRTLADSPTAASGRDVILDWTLGDKIDLSLIDANRAAAGNQAFTFIGATAFSGVAGQLRQINGTGQVVIEGDIDGVNGADFSIAIKGAYTFAGTDFVL